MKITKTTETVSTTIDAAYSHVTGSAFSAAFAGELRFAPADVRGRSIVPFVAVRKSTAMYDVGNNSWSPPS